MPNACAGITGADQQANHQLGRQCPLELRCKHELQKTSLLGGWLFSLKSWRLLVLKIPVQRFCAWGSWCWVALTCCGMSRCGTL